MTNPSPIQIDPAEIIRQMIAQRDQLLHEADGDDAYAAENRQQAKESAEKTLREGEETAANYERRAAERRAYAEHWNGVITREQAAEQAPAAGSDATA